MQRIQMPQVVEDVKQKIAVIEQRITHIKEGIHLYTEAAEGEQDPLQAFNYREQVVKRREELILYTEQLKSQKVYLTEFENDLKQQQQMRRQQLEQVKSNLQPLLNLAKQHIKKNKSLQAQDRQQLSALREKFIKGDFKNDDEKINNFRELGRILQKLSKVAA